MPIDQLDANLLLKSLRAFAKGDFSEAICLPTGQVGIAGEMAEAFNDALELAAGFSRELQRVGTVVGKEGKTYQRAKLRQAEGSWANNVQLLNTLIDELLQPMNEIAHVALAVNNGDLTQRISLEVEGTARQGFYWSVAKTINSMVERLNCLATEVTRVAREVGGEGKLGSQARVEYVVGSWREMIDSVNMMASRLTNQVHQMTELTNAVAEGDLTGQITSPARGEFLGLKKSVNHMLDELNHVCDEVSRLTHEIRVEGKLGVEVDVAHVSGRWGEMSDNVQLIANRLTIQLREISQVAIAVTKGDLTKSVSTQARGELLETGDTINRMVQQLKLVSDEVIRVVREVGNEGQLGGQMYVWGVSGTWREMSDSVNLMANNLSEQVRGMSGVVTAVGNGNLKKRVELEPKGEIGLLVKSLNEMIERLATFANGFSHMTRALAEGKLDSQVDFATTQGIWRTLTHDLKQLANNLSRQVDAIDQVANVVIEGDLSNNVTVEAAGEMALIKKHVNAMIDALRETTALNKQLTWLNSNLIGFNRMRQRPRDLNSAARMILSELASTISAEQGIFYHMDRDADEPILKMMATYAQPDAPFSNRLRLAEALVGQCALEEMTKHPFGKKILLTELSNDDLPLNSATSRSRNIVMQPVLFEERVLAVIELTASNRFSDIQLSFLEAVAESLGIVLASYDKMSATMPTQELLDDSQTLAHQQMAQQSDLKETNKKLQKQTKVLRERQVELEKSNGQLKENKQLLEQEQKQLEHAYAELEEQKQRLEQQQNELEHAYAELEEQTQQLEQQNEDVQRKNREVEQARSALEKKAEQLALASKYKSEFLTNMSHELRTPLNSLLILAQILSENQESNLTGKQVEYAETIHAAGMDLLDLINDILDLSKIEAGTTTIETNEVAFSDLYSNLERSFRRIAQNKELGFIIQVDKSWPEAIYTDSQRLQQILRNLLSNAFKFTERGEISVRMGIVRGGWSRDHHALNTADFVVAFSVSDSGIGIPADKQQIIFESFQQGDGSISRQYGGTGLGLAISRELALLLNGELRLASSTPGIGSTFVFYLPQSHEPPDMFSEEEGGNAAVEQAKMVELIERKVDNALLPAEEVIDDRHNIQSDDPVLLIVEDDARFADLLLDLAHERGFKGLLTAEGETGLELARKFQPDAITLDIKLPTMNGWTVLDRLKHDAKIRHIPVHIISVERARLRALQQGAIGVLEKPVTPQALKEALNDLMAFKQRSKCLLVVEENAEQRQSIIELIGGDDIQTKAVGSATEALAAIKVQAFDCIVLNPRLSEIDGFALLDQIKQSASRETPVIIYTGEELTNKDESRLRQMAQTIIIIKIKAPWERSPERLLDETALFLHRVETKLPESKRQLLKKALLTDPVLINKKILVVDDDVRNLFAITNLLEQQKMQTCYAENGQQCLEVLENRPDVDLVLMDIMMPKMDGYEAMRRIRQNLNFKSLPIIALTAKAMKEDREKCIQAGASDYISKPLDNAQLLSLLRVWLYR